MSLYKKVIGRPCFSKWNFFLLKLAQQGLGINQWQNTEVSGEKYFLEHILPQKKEKTIFDVGAYRGSYSKAALQFHPDSRLLAFEPHPNPSLSCRKLPRDTILMPIN